MSALDLIVPNVFNKPIPHADEISSPRQVTELVFVFISKGAFNVPPNKNRTLDQSRFLKGRITYHSFVVLAFTKSTRGPV